MGAPEPAPSVLLVSAITSNGTVSDEDIQVEVEALWGPVLGCLEPYRFDEFTHYYSEEMGSKLTKTLCAFSKPFRPERLVETKIQANELEQRWTTQGARSVNIDPGYLTPLSFVLASTKPAFHRVYLRDGIYAECTLKFIKGDYVPWEWTYPDYCQPGLRTFLASLRGRTLDLFHSPRDQ